MPEPYGVTVECAVRLSGDERERLRMAVAICRAWGYDLLYGGLVFPLALLRRLPD